jgi:ATP-dependent Lhr-like helicase
MRDRFGVDVQAMHSDDGIVLRLPDIEFTGRVAPPSADVAVFAPDDVEALVTAEVGGSALFASGSASARPAPCCSPPRPRRRQPLWQQRQRSPSCSRSPATTLVPDRARDVREVLQDVFDVPGWSS